MDYKAIKAQRKATRAKEKQERFAKVVGATAFQAILDIRKFPFTHRVKFAWWLLFGRGGWKGV